MWRTWSSLPSALLNSLVPLLVRLHLQQHRIIRGEVSDTSQDYRLGNILHTAMHKTSAAGNKLT